MCFKKERKWSTSNTANKLRKKLRKWARSENVFNNKNRQVFQEVWFKRETKIWQ